MSDTQAVQSRLMDRVIATLSDFNESRTAIIPKLMTITSDANTASHEIAHLLAYDPALTATVVRLANSAFYGRLRSVASLPEAVSVLGINLLRSLVVAASLASLYLGEEDEDLKKLLWDHSLAVALGARILAVRRKSPRREELFLAGLVHDLAQLVLLLRFPREYKPILLAVLKNGVSPRDRERELLGTTHEELGAVMLTQWNFPPRLIEIVRYHNGPDEQAALQIGDCDADAVHEMTQVICFSDELAHALGYGYRKPMVSALDQHPSAQFLGLTDEDIAQVSDELKVQFAEERKLFEGTASAKGRPARIRARLHAQT